MQSSVDEIKAKLDLVDIISEYFPLKQAGANMKAVCPFHDEKTPSFMVSRERQRWHCFGACNEGGDMFTFIQKIENVEFPEALKILANKAGIELKYQDPNVTNLKTRLVNIHEEALNFFVGNLLNTAAGKKAKDYLEEKRKISRETIAEWQLGYALDSWDALGNDLRSKGYNEQEILASGLVIIKDRGGYYDRFRDRIMFPIVDHHGNVVGFTGRTMKKDEMAKYVNSPTTLIYNKSEVIFGLNKAKQYIKEEDNIILVEGNMDVIQSSQAGVKNVIAISGTALTAAQIKILQRYTNNLIFCFDADMAGVVAIKRGIEAAWVEEANAKVVAISRELGKDPDDIARDDPAGWKKLIAGAERAMDYFFEMEFKNYDAADIGKKKIVARNLLNTILKLVDTVEVDFYLKKLADNLNVAETLLREALQKAKNKNRGFLREDKEEDKDNWRKEGLDAPHRAAQRLLGLMMMDFNLAEYASQNLEVDYLPLDLRDIYKAVIVYYTKLQKDGNGFDKIFGYLNDTRLDLRNELNAISFLVSGELNDLDEKTTIKEIKKIVGSLKKESIKKNNIEVSRKIREAENKLSAMSFSSLDEENKIKKEINELLSKADFWAKELRKIDELS